MSAGEDNQAAKKLLSKFTFVEKNVSFTNYGKPPFSGEIKGWYKYEDIYIALTNVPQTGR